MDAEARGAEEGAEPKPKKDSETAKGRNIDGEGARTAGAATGVVCFEVF